MRWSIVSLRSRALRLALAATALAACSSNPASPADAGRDDAGASDAGSHDGGSNDGGESLVAMRPYQLHVPAGYSAQTAAPLLVMLHGYGASGFLEETYLHLTSLSDAKGFLYAYPDGTINLQGQRFWNATDACCNFFGATVDDVAYISAVLDDIEAHYNVDIRRIYLYGHSNGGFMANRLACDLSGRIAAFVSMAGDTWADPSRCRPSAPVSMIQFQGSADATVSYDGGAALLAGGGPYPGARQTADDWAALDGCDGGLQDAGVTLDIVPGLPTTVALEAGCPGAGVELWTVQGGSHIPALQPDWSAPFWDFLSAHAKP